jgi:hypothetical protein
MIPTSLQLTKVQRSAVEAWRKSLPPQDDYEDVCCSSDVTFTVYATGIGDVIMASCYGQKLDLSLADCPYRCLVSACKHASEAGPWVSVYVDENITMLVPKGSVCPECLREMTL